MPLSRKVVLRDEHSACGPINNVSHDENETMKDSDKKGKPSLENSVRKILDQLTRAPSPEVFEEATAELETLLVKHGRSPSLMEALRQVWQAKQNWQDHLEGLAEYVTWRHTLSGDET